MAILTPGASPPQYALCSGQPLETGAASGSSIRYSRSRCNPSEILIFSYLPQILAPRQTKSSTRAWRHLARCPRAATPHARSQTRLFVCSQSLRASPVNWSARARPSSTARRQPAPGTLVFRTLRRNQGASGRTRGCPFQWARGWQATSARPSSAGSTSSGATGAPRAPHASVHTTSPLFCARRLVDISEMRAEDRSQPAH